MRLSRSPTAHKASFFTESSMSFRTSHRIALRAAVATAALAGTMLTPAAAAFADTAPTPSASASPSLPASPTPTPAPSASATTDQGKLIRTDRLTHGLTAKVYRRGDAHIYYTATILKGAKALGELKAGGGYGRTDSKVFDMLKVTLDFEGRITSVDDAGSPGQGPVTPVRCVVTVNRNAGAGMTAEMTIAPAGPSVRFVGAGDETVVTVLDRLHPKPSPRVGFLAEIVNPSGPAPKLRLRTQGGSTPVSVLDFPKLPKGCHFAYDTGGTNGTNGTNGTAQTSVVPKGGVAAGAEYGQDSGTPLIAFGGAAAAAGAGGLGFLVLRRRRAVAGR